MVYIAERRLRERSRQPQTIKIYSNQDQVELLINGKSMGKKQGDGYARFIWDDVNLDEGENKITAQVNSELIDETIFFVR